MESGENAGNATLQAHLQTRWGNASMLAAGQQCTMPFLNFLSAKASSSQDHHAAPSRPRSLGPFQRLPRHVDEQRLLPAGGHQQPGRSVIFPWSVLVCVSFGGVGTRRRSGRTARRRRRRGKRRRRAAVCHVNYSCQYACQIHMMISFFGNGGINNATLKSFRNRKFGVAHSVFISFLQSFARSNFVKPLVLKSFFRSGFVKP